MNSSPPNEMPISVAVDARCLNTKHLRGMGKYLFEIVSRVTAQGGADFELFGNRPDWPLHVPPSHTGTAWHVFELKGSRFHSWEQLGLPWRARRVRADILHCAGTTLPMWQPIPTVVTLHDTIPWSSVADGWPAGIYRDIVLPRGLHKARSIITISESSRNDILQLWPRLDGRINVIPHGVAEAFLETRPAQLGAQLASLGVRMPYLLYVGGEIPRKRFEWATRVYRELADPTLQLVTIGLASEPAALDDRRVQSEAIRSICRLPFVPEEAMPTLYQNAVAVLYPTLYEGFGLPALEAQAVGAPVLFSDVGSLRELKGPGAEVLPPEDLGAWVDTCRRLVEQRGQHPQPNERARNWARQFSWDESARKHLEVYRSVAQKEGRRSATDKKTTRP